VKRKAIAIIPARYASVRFPGKILADLEGKPLIQWVYEKGIASNVDETVVATDDSRIMEAVEAFGGKAVMTSADHPSGSDRICEAAGKIGCADDDIIINIQGDEPLIPVSVINELIEYMRQDSTVEMGTVAVARSRSELENDPNKVKVVFDETGYALYFSRSMIPYLREGGDDTPAYLHWGIYAYRYGTLKKFVTLPQGRLEKCEKLEQLRALENGIRIFVLTSDLESIGVDTPEDLEEARNKIRQMNV